MENDEKGYYIPMDDDDEDLSQMAGLHPAGTYQTALVQIASFMKEFKNKFAGDAISIQRFYVFCFQTVEVVEAPDGSKHEIRRTMDTKHMSGKPFSPNSDMGKLIAQWFGGAKPEELMKKYPKISSFLGRNGIATIVHEESKSPNGSAYARIQTLTPIPVVNGKPVMSEIQANEEYTNFFERKAGFERRMMPGGKEAWFLPMRTEEEDTSAPAPTSEVSETRSRTAGRGGSKGKATATDGPPEF